jgi:hypothetical protein
VFSADGTTIRRAFDETDRWDDQVYRYLKCQEFAVESAWKLLDPIHAGDPLIECDARGNIVRVRNGIVGDFGLFKLSFIIERYEEGES